MNGEKLIGYYLTSKKGIIKFDYRVSNAGWWVSFHLLHTGYFLVFVKNFILTFIIPFVGKSRKLKNQLLLKTWTTISLSSVLSNVMFARRTLHSMTKHVKALLNDLSFQWFSQVSVGFNENDLYSLLCLTACGYNLTDGRIAQLNEFLDKRNATRIDVPSLLAALTHLKELELQAE